MRKLHTVLRNLENAYGHEVTRKFISQKTRGELLRWPMIGIQSIDTVKAWLAEEGYVLIPDELRQLRDDLQGDEMKAARPDREINQTRYAQTKVPVRGDTMAKAAKKLQEDLRKAKRALKLARGIMRDARLRDLPSVERFEDLCDDLGVYAEGHITWGGSK